MAGNVRAEMLPIGSAPGYVDSVEDERNEHSTDLIMIPAPKPLTTPKPFVTDELSKEFQNQYQTKFGYTEVEQNLLPTRYDDYFYNGLYVTYQEDLQRKRDFGTYMIRRVAEYHTDNYFKSDPDLRPVYEAKEKISKIDVELQQGWKVNGKYSLSGNYFELALDNPYEAKIKLAQYLSTNETILTCGYPINPRYDVLTDYRLESSVLRFILNHKISPSLSTNLTYETFTSGLEGQETVDGFVRQKLILVGLTYR
jgi:hypothetical protein